MDWQQIVSLLIVALTAGLLLRRALRKQPQGSIKGKCCDSCPGLSSHSLPRESPPAGERLVLKR